MSYIPHYYFIWERPDDIFIFDVDTNPEINQYVKALRTSFTSIVDAASYLNEDQMTALNNINNPSKVTDKAISLLNVINRFNKI